MKYVTITAPQKMDESIVFLVRPRTTTADILKALKLMSFVLFPLFPIPCRGRLFGQNDKLYEQISNGDCLLALALSDSEAEEFYSMSLLTTGEEFAGFLIKRARAKARCFSGQLEQLYHQLKPVQTDYYYEDYI